jgi:hypothetical protein
MGLVGGMMSGTGENSRLSTVKRGDFLCSFLKPMKDKSMDYITIKTMSSLLVFNKVYRLEIQSVMLVFSTEFMNVRGGGGNGVLGGKRPFRQIKHLPQSLFTGQFFR